MSYDSPDFRVQMQVGPIWGTFASGLKVTGASVETGTSANVHDRFEFFRNIKVLDFKVLTRDAAAATGHAASTLGYRVQLQRGSVVVATAIPGTVAGVMSDGGVASGTSANIDADTACSLTWKVTGDGTTTTQDSLSVDAYILYEHRFA